MTKPSKAKYLRELDRLEPALQRAYLEWVRRRIEAASVSEVERWIETSNIEAIMRELGMSDASFAEISETVRDAYKAGGQFEQNVLASAPGSKFEFDVRNPGAELWLKNNSSKFVTNIQQSQREAVSEALAAGMRNGKNPRTTALDIIGRRDLTGRRHGGIVGLNQQQTSAAGKAWEELSSGEPDDLRNYLTRARRDRRYDAMVRRSIESGDPLTKAQINKISGRYADRLLKLRGETIARTETITAFNAARDQAWTQAIQDGTVDQDYVTSRWSATMDGKTRDSHQSMNDDKRPHGEPFKSPLGSLLRYPGDTELGALREDVINCRCFLEKTVDFIAMEAARG